MSREGTRRNRILSPPRKHNTRVGLRVPPPLLPLPVSGIVFLLTRPTVVAISQFSFDRMHSPLLASSQADRSLPEVRATAYAFHKASGVSEAPRVEAELQV